MTHHDFDLSEVLSALQSDESGDLVRQMVSFLYQALIDAEATEVVQADRHELTLSRTTQRNGSRPRLVSTKAGDVELKIPKLRKGSFFPSVSAPPSHRPGPLRRRHAPTYTGSPRARSTTSWGRSVSTPESPRPRSLGSARRSMRR